MARTTARKLASSTVAAAKRVARGSTSETGAAATESTKTVTKTTATKTTAKKAAATQAPAKKAPAKKAPAKKTAATKAPAKKTPSTKAPAVKKTAAAPTTAAKKAPVKTTTANQTPATPAAKATSKAAAKKPVATAAATKKAAAKKPPAQKAPTRSPAAKKTAAAAKKGSPRNLAVKADEKPWTAAELAEVRGELDQDRERLRSELNLAEHELHDLMRDAGDGAGNDQADVGSTTFERDHEMSLANNAREMLAQTERALGRIDDGTYGVCESCGEPIGKMRLMAFPRATLCLSCKQREERR